MIGLFPECDVGLEFYFIVEVSKSAHHGCCSCKSSVLVHVDGFFLFFELFELELPGDEVRVFDS